MDLKYLSPEEVKDALANVTKPRPNWCSGYTIPFPNSLYHGPPKKGVHYDDNSNSAVTYVCFHEEVDRKLTCQEWAPMAYLLIGNYVCGNITDEAWKKLVPSRKGIPFAGSPQYAPLSEEFPHCEGFMFKIGPYQPLMLIPNTIRLGYHVDRDTGIMPTTACDHSMCDRNIVWKYAMYQAFARNLLDGFDPEHWSITNGKLLTTGIEQVCNLLSMTLCI